MNNKYIKEFTENTKNKNQILINKWGGAKLHTTN